MGLLDNVLGSSFDDPRTAATLQLAQGLLSSPRVMQGLAGGLSGYQQAMAQARQQKAIEEMRQMQMAKQRMDMEALQRQQAKEQGIEAAYRNAFRTPEQMAMAQNGGPTLADAQAAPTMQGGFDQGVLRNELAKVDPLTAYQLFQPKTPDFKVVGNSLVQIGPDGVKEAYTAPAGPMITKAGDVARDPKTGKVLWQNDDKDSVPSDFKLYQLSGAPQRGLTFDQWDLQRRRAGASNVALKIDNKMGEGLAAQVGPMAKDSRIQAQGAVKMFDAADRIEQALGSNAVLSGPGASQIQTVRQLVQVIGGGSDESIRQTRQVIKALAQMSVEARKQLQGQGQVTESEAAAVAKADAGEINDMTPGELRDLVTLTKRAAHYQAKSHQELLGNLGRQQETSGLVPYYSVQGLESLLKHQPSMPKISGGKTATMADVRHTALVRRMRVEDVLQRLKNEGVEVTDAP